LRTVDIARVAFATAAPVAADVPADAPATFASAATATVAAHGAELSLEQHGPLFAKVILENVDAMEDGDSPALDQLLCMLGEQSYDTQAYRLNAASYGLPQSRTRLFLLGVRRPARALVITDCDNFFNTVTQMLVAFETKGPSLEAMLLNDEHPWVQKELASRQQRTPKGWESNTIASHRAEWGKLGARRLAYVRFPRFQGL
jgi:site-specific DNA-cytosine methylase